MAKSEGLNVELLDDFSRHLDQVYSSLARLEVQLGSLDKLGKVDVKAGPGIRLFASSLDALRKSLKDFQDTSAPVMDAAVKNLTSFSTQVAAALTAFGKSPLTRDQAAVLRAFSNTLNSLRMSIKDFSNDSIDLEDVAIRLMLFSSDIVDALSGPSSKVITKEAQSSLRSISAVLDSLRQVMKDFSSENYGAESKLAVERFKEFFSSVQVAIVASSETLTDSNVKQLTAIGTFVRSFTSLFSMMAKLSGGLSIAPTAIPSVISFGSFIDAIFDLAKRVVFMVTSAIKTTGLEDTAEFFAGYAALLRALSPLLTALSGTDISGIIGAAIKTQIMLIPFLFTVDRVSHAAERMGGGGEGLASIGKIFKGFADMLKGVSEFTNDSNIKAMSFTDTMQSMMRMSILLIPVVNALSSIISSATGVNTKNLYGISQIFGVFRMISGFLKEFIADYATVNLKEAATISAKMYVFFLPFTDTVTKIITSLQGVSAANLEGMSTVLASLSSLIEIAGRLAMEVSAYSFVDAAKSVIKMNLFLMPLTSVISSLVSAAHSANPEALTAIASFFEQFEPVINILLRVSRLTEKQGILESIFGSVKVMKAIGPLVSILNPVIESLRGLDSMAVAGIGPLFAGIAEMFTIAFKALEMVKAQSFMTVLKDVTKMQVLLFPFILSIGALVHATKNIPSGNTEVISLLLGEIVKILQIVQRLSKYTANTSILNTLQMVGKMQLLLAPVFNSITPIIKAMSGLNMMPTTVAKLLTSLIALYANLPKLGKGISAIPTKKMNNAALKGWIEDLRELLNVANLSKDAMKSVETVAKFLEKLGTLSAPKTKGIASELKKQFEPVTNITKEVIQEAVEVKSPFSGLFEGLRKGLGFTLEKMLELYTFIKRVRRSLLELTFPPLAVAATIAAIHAVGMAVKQVGTDMHAVGTAARDMGANLVNDFGFSQLMNNTSAQTATDFDRIMTQIRIFGNLTEEETARAQALAYQMGVAYPLSANQAAEATLNLIKAGQQIPDVALILPAAADMAAISDTGDLDQMTNALITAESVFDSFRRGSDEAFEGTFQNVNLATDIFAAAANASTASVEQIAAGLVNAGVAANSAGLSLEETAAMLAVLNDAGVRGAEAGTSLRTVLESLERPTTVAILEDMGIALYTDEGSRRPISDVLDDMAIAMEDMSDPGKMRFLQTIADSFGRTGLQLLMNRGVDGIDAVVDSMRELPTAAQQAADMLDNLAGDTIQLGGSMETLQLRAFLPMVNRFFRPFIKFGRFVVDTTLQLGDGFFEMAASMIAISSIIATFVGGVLILLGTFGQLGGVVASVIGSLLSVTSILGSIAGLFGSIIVSLFGVALMIGVVLPALFAITSAFETLYQILSNNVGGAADAISSLFNRVLSVAGTALGVFAPLQELIGTILGQLSTPSEGIGEWIANAATSLEQMMDTQFLDWIENTATEFMNLVSGLQTVVNLMDSIAAYNPAAEIAADAAQYGTDLTSSERGATLSYDKGAGLFGNSNQIREFSGNMLDAGEATAIFVNTISPLETVLSRFIMSSSLFGDIITRIYGSATKENAQEFARNIHGFVTDIRQSFEDIGGAFTAFWSQGVNFGTFEEKVARMFTQLDLRIGDLIVNILRAVQYLFGGDSELFTSLIQSAELGISEFVQNVWTRFVTGFREGVTSNRAQFKDIFESAIHTVFAFFNNIRFITDLLGAASITNWFNSAEDSITEVLGNVFDFFMDVFAGATLEDAFSDLIGPTIVDSFMELWDELIRAVDLISKAFTLLRETFFPSEGVVPDGETAAFSFSIQTYLDILIGFVRSLNDYVLTPLSVGDFSTVFQNLIGNPIAELITYLTTLAIEADIPELVSQVTQMGRDLWTALIEALVAPPKTTKTEEVSEPFLRSIVTALGVDIDEVFTTIEEGSELFADALTLIGETWDWFFNLATTLPVEAFNSVTSSIGTLFDFLSSPEVQSIMTSVWDILSRIFVSSDVAPSTIRRGMDAVSNVVDVFFGENGVSFAQDSAVLTSLKSLGDVLAEVFTQLTGVSLDTLDSLLTIVEELLNFFAFASDTQITLAIGGVLAVLSTTLYNLASPTIIAGLLWLRSGLVAFYGALRSFMPIFVVILLFNTFVDTLEEFKQALVSINNGDYFQGIYDLFDAIIFFFGNLIQRVDGVMGGLLTSSVEGVVNWLLGMFGMGSISLNMAAINSLRDALSGAFEYAGRALEITFLRIVDTFAARLAILAREIQDMFTPGDDAGLQQMRDYFETATPDFSMGSIRDFMTNVAPEDMELMASASVINQEEMSQQIRDGLQSALDSGQPIEVSAEDVVMLRDLGIFDRVLEDAIFGGDANLANLLIANTEFSTEDIAAIEENLIYAVEHGLLWESEAEAIRVRLPLTVEDLELMNLEEMRETFEEMVPEFLESEVIAVAPATTFETYLEPIWAVVGSPEDWRSTISTIEGILSAFRVGVISSFWRLIKWLFSPLTNAIQFAWGQFMNFTSLVVSRFWAILRGVWGMLPSVITGWLAGVQAAIRAMFAPGAPGLLAVLRTLPGLIANAVKGFAGMIPKGLVIAWDLLGGAISIVRSQIARLSIIAGTLLRNLATSFATSVPILIANIVRLGRVFAGFAIRFAGGYVLSELLMSLIENIDEFREALDLVSSGDYLAAFGELMDGLFMVVVDTSLPFANMVIDFLNLDEMFNIVQVDTADAFRDIAYDTGMTIVRIFQMLWVELARMLEINGANMAIQARRLQDSLTFGDDVELGLATQFFDVDKVYNLDTLRELVQGVEDQGITLDGSITASFAVSNQADLSRGIRASIVEALAAGDPLPVSTADVIALEDLDVLPRILSEALFQGQTGVLDALFAAGISDEMAGRLVDDVLLALELGVMENAEGLDLLISTMMTIEAPDPNDLQAMVDLIQAQMDSGEMGISEARALYTELQVILPDTDETNLALESFRNALHAIPIQFIGLPTRGEGTTGDADGGTDKGGRGDRFFRTMSGTQSGSDNDKSDPYYLIDKARNAMGETEQRSASPADNSVWGEMLNVVMLLQPEQERFNLQLTSMQITLTLVNLALIVTNVQLTLMNLNTILVNSNLVRMLTHFSNIRTQGTSAITDVRNGMTIMNSQLTAMLSTWGQGFALVIEKANVLAKTLNNLVLSTQAIDGNVSRTLQGVSGGDGADTALSGFAQGGSFDTQGDATKYRINEGGSEVLEENGGMYLLSSGRGRIRHLSDVLPNLRASNSSGLYPTVSRQPAYAAAASNTNISVGESPINITINGANANPQEIAQAVLTQVQSALGARNESIQRTLRVSHRG